MKKLTTWWYLQCLKKKFNNSWDDQSLGLEIEQYGFFGADTNISTIHGQIADTSISKILKSCFLLHYQKYVFHALPFLQKLQKSWLMS